MPGKPDPDRVAALRAWEETFGSPPPPYLSVAFLHKAVAHEVQCRLHGGHSAATKRALRKIAEGRAVTDSTQQVARAGAHLVREWNGRTYQVEVLADGYRMDGRTWPSLSGIRDKIAASKRKGLWMGGKVPQGYDPDGRRLRVNEREASTIRTFYDLYERLGTIREVIRNLARAHAWLARIKAGETFAQVSDAEGTSKRRIQQMIDLAFLAPDIVRDVMDGKQPLGFTSDWCLRHDLPSDWQDQRALLATL